MKPYSMTKKGVGAACEAQNGSRVIAYEPGPIPHLPRRFRTIHTIGYVYREGAYGWTADRGPDKSPLGGYATRAAAAEVLWQNWMAENFAVAQRITEAAR